MALKPPRICGCGRKVPGGQKCPCQIAKKIEMDKKRPSASQRGYDSRWRALRLKFLQVNPMCCHPGCDERATEVDHIETIRDRPDLRLAWKNLRPFCKRHHSSRTLSDLNRDRNNNERR